MSVANLASGLLGTFTLGFWNLEGLQLWAMKRFVEYAEVDVSTSEPVIPQQK